MNRKHSPRVTAYSAPLVHKTIKVMNMILTATHNPGVSEIAAELSLAKSTTHGILAALEASGWVLRDPVTRGYTCGHYLSDLAGSAKVRIQLTDEARPFLEKLSAEIDEDVFLGMFTWDYILILDQVESARELKVASRPGARLSIFSGASGKMFLAFQPRDVVTRVVRSATLPRFTAKSVTEPEAYLAELDRVRREGVAYDIEEYIPDVRATAAPIFHGKGSRRRLVAGVWTVGLSWGLHDGKIRTAADLTRKTAEEISKAITARVHRH
ncbi:MAG: IclR family transcriptional regulator [Desulfomonile sp.]|nr:IclR family transcriptional regulator [Desulfomonile sp.]